MGEAQVVELFAGFNKRQRQYTIVKVLQMYLNQVMSRMSCVQTVLWAMDQGIVPLSASANNSCYSAARSRLPEEQLKTLMKSVGAKVEEQARACDKYKGRRVKVVDGSSVQLMDTVRNQIKYPQPSEQKRGCGFPVMNIVALMGLGTGVILDAVVGAIKDSERTLFRKLWDSLDAGDILLGDRGFGSYAEVAMLKARGVDAVFRQRRGCLKNKEIVEVNGSGDYLIKWKRPSGAGDWIARDMLPKHQLIRAVCFTCRCRNNRFEEVILFTTFLDPKQHSHADLAHLYYRRWEMELRLRDIKSVMGLELIACKTPERCRKQLWIGLTAYGLVRAVMLDAAKTGRISIARISFKITLHCVAELGNSRFVQIDFEYWYQRILAQLIRTQVPYRPGRNEPRERKRRPKGYKLMTKRRNPAPKKALVA